VNEQGWNNIVKKLTDEGRAKNFFDSTFLTVGGLETEMNTSSSQTELVQSWGLGHSSHLNGPTHWFWILKASP